MKAMRNIFIVALALIGFLVAPKPARAEDRPAPSFRSEYLLSASLDADRPVPITFKREPLALPKSFQEPAPDPAYWPIFDLAYSTDGRLFQVNRIEQRFKDYGNGAYGSLYTGSGWALDNGAPLLSPIGLSFGGEVDLGLFVLVVSVGGDLLLIQNENTAFVLYGRLGFRVPTD